MEGDGGDGQAGARCAPKDAQDVRGRLQEDAHRRPDRASPAAAAVFGARDGSTGLGSGELGWRTVLRDVIRASKYKGKRFLKGSITLSLPSRLGPSPYVRLYYWICDFYLILRENVRLVSFYSYAWW